MQNDGNVERKMFVERYPGLILIKLHRYTSVICRSILLDIGKRINGRGLLDLFELGNSPGVFDAG
jgi:hypothetical protein